MLYRPANCLIIHVIYSFFILVVIAIPKSKIKSNATASITSSVQMKPPEIVESSTATLRTGYGRRKLKHGGTTTNNPISVRRENFPASVRTPSLTEDREPSPVTGHTAARIDGDIILGGLFPIHNKGHGMTSSTVTSCDGEIQPDRGIQRLEAMLFTIDHINNNPHVLPGVQLGAQVYDTCSRDIYALDQTFEFVQASPNLYDTAMFQCGDRTQPTLVSGQTEPVVGVVGGSYSSVSIQVAHLLRLFKIPQVSYASTSVALSDKTRFRFFARTVPPDNYQAKAMADIVEHFNWSYVNTVASEGEYGDKGIDSFSAECRHRNICIAVSEKVSPNANAERFDDIVSRLLVKRSARIVILFLRVEDARNLLSAVSRRHNISGHFIWVASDGWGKEEMPVRVPGNEAAAEGALTIELQTTPLPEFDTYFRRLTPNTNLRNPWFREYWSHAHNCVFHDNIEEKQRGGSDVMRYSPMTPPMMTSFPINDLHSFVGSSLVLGDTGLVNQSNNLLQAGTKRRCTGRELLTTKIYTQESKIQFVFHAVYSFAHALHHMVETTCSHLKRSSVNGSVHDFRQPTPGRYASRQSAFKKCLRGLNGTDLYEALLNVSFDGTYNLPISQCSFPCKVGEIKRIQQGPGTYNLPISQCSFPCKVGEIKRIQQGPGTYNLPISQCSFPCKVGEIKRIQQGDACCWVCTSCEPVEYLVDELTCRPCPDGWWPTQNRTGCYLLEEQYMRWDSVFAIVPVAISVIGLTFNGVVFVTFVRHFDTPVVKASGRELSFMLFVGFAICYLMTFVILAKPGPLICGAQRFGIGFGFAVTYSALLTKTNRISRIFDSARHSARRPMFISPRSQVVITLLLISVQVAGAIVWLLLEPPDVGPYYPFGRRDQVVLKCRTKDVWFLLSLGYNMLLILICTIYAVKTRQIPENFNESKHIGFAMYTTCVIWLGFIPIYFGTLNSFQVQITTLCISISLSATVALLCLFLPKIHIILFQSDKNIRKLTINTSSVVVGLVKKSMTSNASSEMASGHQASGLMTSRYSGGTAARTDQTVIEQVDLDHQMSALHGESLTTMDPTDQDQVDFKVASL